MLEDVYPNFAEMIKHLDLVFRIFTVVSGRFRWPYSRDLEAEDAVSEHAVQSQETLDFKGLYRFSSFATIDSTLVHVTKFQDQPLVEYFPTLLAFQLRFSEM